MGEVALPITYENDAGQPVDADLQEFMAGNLPAPRGALPQPAIEDFEAFTGDVEDGEGLSVAEHVTLSLRHLADAHGIPEASLSRETFERVDPAGAARLKRLFGASYTADLPALQTAILRLPKAMRETVARMRLGDFEDGLIRSMVATERARHAPHASTRTAEPQHVMPSDAGTLRQKHNEAVQASIAALDRGDRDEGLRLGRIAEAIARRLYGSAPGDGRRA